jgi:ADP-heptose:LPS heptosyltransferase
MTKPFEILWHRLENSHYRHQFESALAQTTAYPADEFRGRGIVMCVGTARCFTSAWVNINILRHEHRCALPIEAWYFGAEEMNTTMVGLLEQLDVRVMDGTAYAEKLPEYFERGYALKVTAVLHSSFREVLFMDADNTPVKDPAFLFSSAEYLATGALFWPNIMITDPNSRIWEILDIPYVSELEFESGQMALDKTRCWNALMAVWHLTQHFPFYYRHVFGDPETFHMCWRKLQQAYATPAHPSVLIQGIASTSMLNQYDFDGNLLFQHRTQADWKLSGDNPHIEGFQYDARCRHYLKKLAELWDGEVQDKPVKNISVRPFPKQLDRPYWFLQWVRNDSTQLLEFLPDSRIGFGTGWYGAHWKWVESDPPRIDLIARGHRIAHLMEGADQIWRGVRPIGQRADIELIPIPKPARMLWRTRFQKLARMGSVLNPATLCHFKFTTVPPAPQDPVGNCLQEISQLVSGEDLCDATALIKLLDQLTLLIIQQPQEASTPPVQALLESIPQDRCPPYAISAMLRLLASIFHASPAARRNPAFEDWLTALPTLPLEAAHETQALLSLLLAHAPDQTASDCLLKILSQDELPDTEREQFHRMLHWNLSFHNPSVSPADCFSLARNLSCPHRCRQLFDTFLPEQAQRAPAFFTPQICTELVTMGVTAASQKTFYGLLERKSPAAAKLFEDKEQRPFPARETVRHLLTAGSPAALIIHNIQDGQGDELARCVALLQSLLDANPEMRVTLLTCRTYLYDHPRLRVISIHDTDQARNLFPSPWDLVINFFEPIEGKHHNLQTESLWQSARKERQPPIWIQTRKDINLFLFETVQIQGKDYASEWGLDRPALKKNYDTTLRLIFELGLPARTGQEEPVSEWVLAGSENTEALALWNDLTAQCGVSDNGNDKVALVNPMGGAGSDKGFDPDQPGALVQFLKSLLEEGYAIVLIPNGTAWGNAKRLQSLLPLLDHAERSRVVIAPDPGEDLPGREFVSCRGRETWSHADITMHHFKTFALQADLVVAVEGWLIHMAYALGRPYRILMMPGSYPTKWFPFPASEQQAIANTGSEADRNFASVRGKHFQQESPRLCWGQERHMLLALLGAQQKNTHPDLVAWIRQLLKSPDIYLRKKAFSCLNPEMKPFSRSLVTAGLNDPAFEVRAAAALSALNLKLDLSAEMGSDYKQQLMAHIHIGAYRWQDLIPLGSAACSALQLTLHDESDEMRRDAAIMLDHPQIRP